MVPDGKERRSGDPEAGQGSDAAKNGGIETARDRSVATHSGCVSGEAGLCCTDCLRGPCHLDPQGGPTAGICGARDHTIVARNLIRHIAGGAAVHSAKGREIAKRVMSVLTAGAGAQAIKDTEKLTRVADGLEIDVRGKEKDELARLVVKEALGDYSRFDDEPLRFTTSTITAARRKSLDRHGLLPGNIDRVISDVMHRTSLVGDAEPVSLLFEGIACAIADYDGMQISTDLSDMLSGTPELVHASIPETNTEVIAGFSLEQIEELLSKLSPDVPIQALSEAIEKGQLRGIVLLAGCDDHETEHELVYVAMAKELLKNDVLVLATGCSADALGEQGLLSSAATEKHAGPGLTRFIRQLEKANEVSLPPAWHLGSSQGSTRAMNLATRLAKCLRVDCDAVPFAASAPEAGDETALSMGTWFVAFGATFHIGTTRYVGGSPLIVEMLTNTAEDVFGGRFIPETDPFEASKKLLNELERRRWKLGWQNAYKVPEAAAIKKEGLMRKAIDGAIIATGYADVLLSRAIELHGCDKKVEFPETGYSLPSIFAWEGKEVHRLGDMVPILDDVRSIIRYEATYENALAAGEAAMVSAEIIEALKYAESERPYEGTPYSGFIPDKVLRQLGIAFVDDTIPGAAVIVGTASDPKKLVKVVRDCQSKGMLVVATDDAIRQLGDERIRMGLDAMLVPVGEFTQAIHGLNFAIRAALTFGGVQKGDRERLRDYLKKRPKVFVLQLGPIDAIRAATEFAVLLNGSPTITDQQIETIPDAFVSEPDYERLVQTVVELRGIQVKLAPVAIPVAYGPAFEGESIRRPDAYIEAGGAAKTTAFELLRLLPEDQVEDGKIDVVGRDVDKMEEGGKTPLAILVDVYGKKMQEDFEPVLERRIHQFINFAEGAWHTGQRNTIWVRLSKSSVKSGLRFKHFGDILITKLKAEFGGIVSRVQVTLVTDPARIEELLPLAIDKYAARDERMSGLTDEAVDTFASCQLCQSFAPNHVCIVTPERLGLCGAVSYLDAKAGKEIAPNGPNQPVVKGEVIDPVKGQWRGVNEAVYELSHHKLERFNAYTMMEDPMTSCGCFEVIAAMTADAQAVVLVNREYPGMTPVGMKFSTLAGSIGGGKQTPGFIGIGRKYIFSKKFISADGGFLRIAWMPKELKMQLMDSLKRRAEELGVPDFVDKIADETVSSDAEGLTEWMAKVNHPALSMPPLLQ